MDFDLRTELLAGCRALDITIDEDAVERLEFYFVELKKWNKKANLIAKNTKDSEIVENHFVDSLALLNVLPVGATLVDIGTGAGLPGLICKAARPDLNLHLVEPRAKRILFMRHIIRGLSLVSAEVYEARIEDTDIAEKKNITHLTSRAVSDIEGFVEMTSAFGPEVKRLCLKGPKWQEELSLAKDVLKEHKLAKETVLEYKLPSSQAYRSIVILKAHLN